MLLASHLKGMMLTGRVLTSRKLMGRLLVSSVPMESS